MNRKSEFSRLLVCESNLSGRRNALCLASLAKGKRDELLCKNEEVDDDDGDVE